MIALLVRHGQTAGNREHRYVGRTDEGLLPEAAAALSASPYRAFRPQVVYCSPLLRCRQTAEILFFGAEPERASGWSGSLPAAADAGNGQAQERGEKSPAVPAGRSGEWREEVRSETTQGGHAVLETIQGAATELPTCKSPKECPLLIVCRDLRETDFGAFEYKNYEELNSDPAYQAWIDSGGLGPLPGGESGAAFRARCRNAFAACLRDAVARGAKRIAFAVHGGTIMAVMEAFADPPGEFYRWQVKNGEGFLVTASLENGRPVLTALPTCSFACNPEQDCLD